MMRMVSFYSVPLFLFVFIASVNSYLKSSSRHIFNRLSRNIFLNVGNVEKDHQQEGDSTHLLRKNVELYDQHKYGTITANDLASTNNRMKSSSSIYGTKPEVLAPAGGWPQLRAAVANGADACYFGLQEGFNARARAR